MRWKSFKFNIIQSAGKFIFNGTQRKKTMKLNYLVEGWREGKKTTAAQVLQQLDREPSCGQGCIWSRPLSFLWFFRPATGLRSPAGHDRSDGAERAKMWEGGGRGRTSLLVIEGARRTQLTVWWVQSTPPASSPPTTDTQKRTHLPEHLN